MTESDGEAFRERLRQLVDLRGDGNVSLFARLCGINLGTMHGWVKGPSEPKRAELGRIADATGVRLCWLLYGRGAMLRDEAEPELRTRDSADTGMIEVPLFDIELAAGDGRIPWDHAEPEAILRFPEHLIRNTFHARGRLIALRVAGNSMSPTIRDRTIVLIDPDIHRVDRDGAVYAIRAGELLVIKRCFAVPGGRLRLVGDNRDTPEVEIGPEQEGQLQVLGRVAGVLNRP